MDADAPAPGRWPARLNFAAGWLAAGLTLLGLGLFVFGQLTPEPHAGLWGLLLAVWALPFAGAFWLAGHAWRHRWRARAVIQLAPALVLLLWIAVGRWLSVTVAVQAP